MANIRLLSEIAFEALEKANIPISKFKGREMGVFVAAGMDEGYIKLLFADKGRHGWCLYLMYHLFQTSGVSTNGLVGMNKDIGDWIGCECGDLVVDSDR